MHCLSYLIRAKKKTSLHECNAILLVLISLHQSPEGPLPLRSIELARIITFEQPHLSLVLVASFTSGQRRVTACVSSLHQYRAIRKDRPEPDCPTDSNLGESITESAYQHCSSRKPSCVLSTYPDLIVVLSMHVLTTLLSIAAWVRLANAS